MFMNKLNQTNIRVFAGSCWYTVGAIITMCRINPKCPNKTKNLPKK